MSIRKKLMALTLALMMVFSMIPFSASVKAAGSITVYLTVSNKGTLAKAKDSSDMVKKQVTVTDLDGNGSYTYDEALVAAHKLYNSEDGYFVDGYVKKLWGVESTNNLFYLNDEAIPNGVTEDTVTDGANLYVSVNADEKYYADWYTKFDKDTLNAEVGSQVTLTITGHKGMAFSSEEKVFVPLEGITLKTLDGKVLGTTDKSGKVTFTPDKVGEMILTASGVAKLKEVTDWNLMDLTYGGDPPVYGTMDFDTEESTVAYTEADHGDGPYPLAEVKYIDFWEWFDMEDAKKAAYHVLHSNTLLTDCPIMAPACVLTVTEKTIAAGTKATVGNLKYQVADATTAKVLAGKKKTLAKVSVPATVTIEGKSFKVTEIGPKAFKNNKKLKKVVIGANVKTIGNAAFAGDKKLKSIVVKSKVLKKVGSKAFKGINKKAVIKVPKAKKKAYNKLFKKKGQAKTVKIK